MGATRTGRFRRVHLLACASSSAGRMPLPLHISHHHYHAAGLESGAKWSDETIQRNADDFVPFRQVG